MRELHVCLLLLLLLAGEVVATVYLLRLHGWLLKLTVRRQQIVVLRLQSQRQVGWRGMRPQRPDRVLDFVASVGGAAHVAAVPRTAADVLRSQQLRLSLLAVGDGRRKRRLEIALGRLRDGRGGRRNVPNRAERLLVQIMLDGRTAPQRVEVGVVRGRQNRR